MGGVPRAPDFVTPIFLPLLLMNIVSKHVLVYASLNEI